jgi:hypothetical protein
MTAHQLSSIVYTQGERKRKGAEDRERNKYKCIAASGFGASRNWIDNRNRIVPASCCCVLPTDRESLVCVCVCWLLTYDSVALINPLLMYVCCLRVYTFRLEKLRRKETCNQQLRHPSGCIHTVLLGPLIWYTINMFLCLTRCIVQFQSYWEKERERDLFVTSYSFVWFSFPILQPTRSHSCRYCTYSLII